MTLRALFTISSSLVAVFSLLASQPSSGSNRHSLGNWETGKPAKLANCIMVIEHITTAIVFVTVCMPFLAVTLWAIVDAAGREFATFNQKVVWMLVASIPFLGFIVYLIFGRWRGKKDGAES